MCQPSKLALYLVTVLIAQFSAAAEDHVTSYAPEEPLFINQPSPVGLKESDLRDLPITDPKLRVAYCFLMRAANGRPEIVDDRIKEFVAILNDLKRRGDSATPLLLDMMEKNHNTRLEDSIPTAVAQIPTIKLAPYLDYLRRMFRTRLGEISATANEIALELFFNFGTRDDVILVLESAKKRPFLAPSVKRVIDSQNRELPERVRIKVSDLGPALTSIFPTQARDGESTPTKPKQTKTSAQQPDSTVWLPVATMIVAATGLLWLMLKCRTK